MTKEENIARRLKLGMEAEHWVEKMEAARRALDFDQIARCGVELRRIREALKTLPSQQG